jgi:hypothetical protein
LKKDRLRWAKNGNGASRARTADGYSATERRRDPARSDVDRAGRFQARERERPERTLPRTDSDGEMEDTRDLAACKLLRRRAGACVVARRSRPSACGVAVSPERIDARCNPETDESGDEERSPAIGHYYGSASGNSKKKVEPSPSAETTHTRPSICRTSSRQM